MDIDIILDSRLSAEEICELAQLAEANDIRTVWVASYLDAVKETHSVYGLPQRVMDSLIDNLTLMGAPGKVDRIIEHLAELKAVGMSEAALELRQQPDLSIKLLGEKVIPALCNNYSVCFAPVSPKRSNSDCTIV